MVLKQQRHGIAWHVGPLQLPLALHGLFLSVDKTYVRVQLTTYAALFEDRHVLVRFFVVCLGAASDALSEVH
jgi:hypothetical protein